MGLVLTSCATYRPIGGIHELHDPEEDKEIEHSFYLVGNTALSKNDKNNNIVPKMVNVLRDAPPKSTLLFLGNSVPDPKFGPGVLKDEKRVLEGYNGTTIFIPGEQEWRENIDDLRKIEKNIDDLLGKNSFLPERGCPIEEVGISDRIVLIIIDSQWYLSPWNNYPKINDNCSIKDRESFYLEIEVILIGFKKDR